MNNVPELLIPARVLLVDRSQEMADAWSRSFAGCEGVQPICGDYFSRPADAMVSPANSFGVMDGGLDLYIRDALGVEVQARVQKRILRDSHGELPVGQAVLVDTEDARWPRLVVAPTMRVPESVAHTVNAYLVFRAVLLCLARFNAANPESPIDSVVCPGLCTGIGAMDFERSATQMRMAYDQVRGSGRVPSFREIRQAHGALLSA